MSRELLVQAGQAGAGLGDGPLTIDLDSTICETSSLTTVVTRQSAREEVRRSCVPEHRAWTPAGSPVEPPDVEPPDVVPHARLVVDIVSRSIQRRHPSIPGRSAA